MKNRVIKFRAWDKTNHKWSPNPIEFHKGHAWIITGRDDAVYVTDNFTIQQFVGLLDKNGTEIYEGDVLICKDGSLWHRGNVIFSEGQFWTPYDWTEVHPEIDRACACDFTTREVIGNVFETPELVTAQKS